MPRPQPAMRRVPLINLGAPDISRPPLPRACATVASARHGHEGPLKLGNGLGKTKQRPKIKPLPAIDASERIRMCVTWHIVFCEARDDPSTTQEAFNKHCLLLHEKQHTKTRANLQQLQAASRAPLANDNQQVTAKSKQLPAGSYMQCVSIYMCSFKR